MGAEAGRAHKIPARSPARSEKGYARKEKGPSRESTELSPPISSIPEAGNITSTLVSGATRDSWPNTRIKIGVLKSVAARDWATIPLPFRRRPPTTSDVRHAGNHGSVQPAR